MKTQTKAKTKTETMLWAGLLSLASMSVTACGSSDEGSASTTDASASTDAASADMAAPGDMAATDAGGSADMANAQDDMAEPMAAPGNGTDIFPWLQEATNYNSWPAESAVHSSTGPHGKVRTYLNPTLEASLKDNRAAHPKGSTAIKELYEANGETLKGWAVMVKTSADSAAGDGWYWYEIFSTTDGSNPVADGQGVNLCKNCHGMNSKDFIRTPYPLQ